MVISPFGHLATWESPLSGSPRFSDGAARPREARDEAAAHGISHRDEDNGGRARDLAQRGGHRRRVRQDNAGTLIDELTGLRPYLRRVGGGEAQIDAQVAVDRPAEFAELPRVTVQLPIVHHDSSFPL